MYKIIIYNEKIFAKDISKIPYTQKNIIFKKIKELEIKGNINSQTKRLKNYPIADRRLRIGNYRILFNIDIITSTITIFRILHRSKLY